MISLAIELAADSMEKASTHRKIGTHDLWWKPGFQLPAYIQHVASHFIDSHGESGAISMAIGIIRNWASGRPSGGEKKVHPDTVAAAQKALDEWEALKAKAKTVKSTKHFADDPPAVELASVDMKRDTSVSSVPIANVKILRGSVLSYGRCPPSKRDALVANIRSSAEALGASDLPWLKNFLASNPGSSS